ncbi:hypothetical protein Q1M63_11780 (plasmid) [Sinorhizobium meliloti]|nr:hypothetical protein Q1M63_11780 [Sinorhizobium meliloti]
MRLGVDNIFQANSSAFLISGWLLDPDEHVQSVRLRRGQSEMRLDDRWTRLERSDVTDAFTDEPLFKSMLDRETHPHGFIVFAGGLGGRWCGPATPGVDAQGFPPGLSPADTRAASAASGGAPPDQVHRSRKLGG